MIHISYIYLAISDNCLFYPHFSRAFATDLLSLFFVFYLVFSLLGNWQPYFFAYHIFQLIVRSNQLKTVVQAIRKSIVTLLFMVNIRLSFHRQRYLLTPLFVLSLIGSIHLGSVIRILHLLFEFLQGIL